MNKFQYGSYYDQEVEAVVEVDPHYVLHCHDTIHDHGIPEECYQRAVKLIHDEIDALDREIDKEGDTVVILREFMGPTEDPEIDDVADWEQCF